MIKRKNLSGPAKLIRDYMWDMTGPHVTKGQWMTVTQIHAGVVNVRGTSTSTGAVAKTLEDLHGMGLLELDNSIRPKLYSWDNANPQPNDYQARGQTGNLATALQAAAKGKGTPVTTPTGTLTDDQKRQALRGKLK